MVDITANVLHTDGTTYTGTSRAIFYVGRDITDLGVSAQVAAAAPAENEVVLVVQAVNNGPDPAQDVEVNLDLPAGVTLVGNPNSGATQGEYDDGNDKVVWRLGELLDPDRRPVYGRPASETLRLRLAFDPEEIPPPAADYIPTVTGTITNAQYVAKQDPTDPDSPCLTDSDDNCHIGKFLDPVKTTTPSRCR